MANKKSTWVVYHLIHVTFPYRRIAKLFITDVPENVEVTWDLVDCYRAFGEFGIPHANHRIEKLTNDSPSDIKRAYKNREAEFITYDELLEYSKIED